MAAPPFRHRAVPPPCPHQPARAAAHPHASLPIRLAAHLGPIRRLMITVLRLSVSNGDADPVRLVQAPDTATGRKAGELARCDTGSSWVHRVRGTKQGVRRGRRARQPARLPQREEIHAELRRQGETVGLTTVYRHLQVLSEQGVIDTILYSSGESLYRQREAPPRTTTT